MQITPSAVRASVERLSVCHATLLTCYSTIQQSSHRDTNTQIQGDSAPAGELLWGTPSTIYRIYSFFFVA